MFYTVDMLNKVLDNEQVPDPSVTPDTSMLDLQSIVARLDRLEQTISTLRQTDSTNDSGAVDNDSGAINNEREEIDNES